MNKSNATRFIEAYNEIDYGLRTIYGFKRSMSFTDVVRRAVMLNSVVRKYEEDLIDFGRLRNAIIHNGNKKYTIAEPHDEVVKEIEFIANLITEPPLALDRVGNKEVVTVDSSITIKRAMEMISRTGYSNLPVYQNEKLIGILNARKLIAVLGNKSIEGKNLQEVIETTTAGDMLSEMGEDYFYILADKKLTIDTAMNLFENNRKLMVILITGDGKPTGKPLSIISVADVVDMKKILDVY